MGCYPVSLVNQLTHNNYEVSKLPQMSMTDVEMGMWSHKAGQNKERKN